MKSGKQRKSINNSMVQNHKLIFLLKLLIGNFENSYDLLAETSSLTVYRFLEKAKDSKSHVL